MVGGGGRRLAARPGHPFAGAVALRAASWPAGRWW